MPNICQVQHLSFHYGQQSSLLKDISFQITSGQALALLGPNGSGKTSLLKCLSGTLKPSHGQIKRSGGPLAHLPQTTTSLFGLSVLEVVVMGRASKLSWLQTPSRTDYDLASQAIADVGLADFAQSSIHDLSGGQQQLVFIAQLLATQATLLLLDEPTAALDFSNQYRVLYLLKKLVQSGKYSIIFTTHQPEHALFLGTHALLLFDDHTTEFGPIDEVVTKANLEKLYHMKLQDWSESKPGHRFSGIMPAF